MAPPLRRFALFGPRAAGKTVFLTALYGTSQHRPNAEDGYLITAADDPADPTHKTLKDWLLMLMKGEWLPPNAFENLKILRFSFTTRSVRYDVELPDVAGEVTRRFDSVEDYEALEGHLKQKILAEYQDFHGYVIFVPGQNIDQRRAAEFKWEVDALLNALKERTQDGGMIARPVAILMTKWDLHSPTPVSDEDEAAKAEQFFAKDHATLLHALRATCRNLRIFPVSATGPLDEGRPPKQMQPYNLATPIKWLLETSDRVWIERAQAYCKANQSRLFERIPPDRTRSHWEVAVERFREAVENLPPGSLSDDATKGIKSLSQLRRRRRMKFATIATACCLLIGVGIWGLVDRNYFKTARGHLPSESSDPSKAATLLSQVNSAADGSWKHWVGRSLGWEQALQSDMTKLAAHHSETVFLMMQRLKRDDLDEGQATELLQLVTLWRDLAQFFTPPNEQPLAVGLLEKVAKRGLFECRAKRDYDVVQERAKPFLPPQPAGFVSRELLDELLALIKTFITNFGESDDFGASKYVPDIQALQAKLEPIKVHIAEQQAWDQLAFHVLR